MPDAGGILLVCATPIGNLGDVTLRVLDALRTADAIAAWRQDGETVFVHCVHAQSRTPTIGAAYLIRLFGVGAEAALREVIAQVATQTTADPIRALSVASLVEAVTPISIDGQPLGPCLLGCDGAHQSHLDVVRDKLGVQRLFDITGQADGPACVLHTLCWIRDALPQVYAAAWRFMPWSGLACALLGGRTLSGFRPVTDPAVLRHGGRIVRTVGDGLLVDGAYSAAIQRANAGYGHRRFAAFRRAVASGPVRSMGSVKKAARYDISRKHAARTSDASDSGESASSLHSMCPTPVNPCSPLSL